MTRILLLALALGVSGCTAADQEAEANDPVVEAIEPSVEATEPADDATVSAPEEAKADPVDGTVRVQIKGFECGDNCYLEYAEMTASEEAGVAAESQTALCSVDVCGDWFENQEMPSEMVGRSALITIGKGSQVDGAGNEMSNDFSEITSIAVDAAE